MSSNENVPDLSAALYERSGPRGLSLHSHLDPPLSPEVIRRLARPHRTAHYFLLFVEEGRVDYSVDLEEVSVSAGEETGDLVIAYLNAIMSELERAYFARRRRRGSARNIEGFMGFQAFVEEHFRRQPLVSDIARSLGMSESALYSSVSVKELADHLGFEDESYFSRFFRKQTGRSISQFIASSADLSSTSGDSSLTRAEQVR